jgi:TRAP-type C4-dicarboxylate transport system permease small subunit
MKSLSAVRVLQKGVPSVMKVIQWIGYVSLSGMVLITTANVFGRYVLKRPLLGEYDMVELGMAIFGGVAMFLAATERHHVSVDVLLVRFSRPTQVILGRTASFVGFVTWTLLACLAFWDGLDNLRNGNCSATLLVPQGPFEIILSIMIFLFGLTLLIQVFSPGGSEKKEGGGPEL